MIGSKAGRAMRAAWASSLILGLAIAIGCGVKSAPLPPEQVLPQRIVDLRAFADPYGIKVSWQRPTTYTSGRTMRDLGSFVLLRAGATGAFAPLIELPVTDRERFAVQHEFSYIDAETALGHRYRYQIISKTTDGYLSEASNEVDFTRVKPAPTPNPENYQLPTPTPLGNGGS